MAHQTRARNVLPKIDEKTSKFVADLVKGYDAGVAYIAREESMARVAEDKAAETTHKETREALEGQVKTINDEIRKADAEVVDVLRAFTDIYNHGGKIDFGAGNVEFTPGAEGFRKAIDTQLEVSRKAVNNIISDRGELSEWATLNNEMLKHTGKAATASSKSLGNRAMYRAGQKVGAKSEEEQKGKVMAGLTGIAGSDITELAQKFGNLEYHLAMMGACYATLNMINRASTLKDKEGKAVPGNTTVVGAEFMSRITPEQVDANYGIRAFRKIGPLQQVEVEPRSLEMDDDKINEATPREIAMADAQMIQGDLGERLFKHVGEYGSETLGLVSAAAIADAQMRGGRPEVEKLLEEASMRNKVLHEMVHYYARAYKEELSDAEVSAMWKVAKTINGAFDALAESEVGKGLGITSRDAPTSGVSKETLGFVRDEVVRAMNVAEIWHDALNEMAPPLADNLLRYLGSDGVEALFTNLINGKNARTNLVDSERDRQATEAVGEQHPKEVGVEQEGGEAPQETNP